MPAAPVLFHELAIRPSRYLQGLLIIGYGLPLCAAEYAADLSWWIKALLGMLMIGCAWYQINRYARLSHALSITGLKRTPQGWQCYVASQGWRSAQLCPSGVCWSQGIVLRFCLDKRHRYVYLMNDSAEQDALRQLRVWLRMAPF